MSRLKQTYKALRRGAPNLCANEALALARNAVAAGGGLSAPRAPELGCEFEHCGQRCRVFTGDDPAALGFFAARFADEVARIGHYGWFADEAGNEIYRAVVFAFRGPLSSMLLPGYHSRSHGWYILAFDCASFYNNARDLAIVAKWADSIAARAAREARERSAATASRRPAPGTTPLALPAPSRRAIYLIASRNRHRSSFSMRSDGRWRLQEYSSSHRLLPWISLSRRKP